MPGTGTDFRAVGEGLRDIFDDPFEFFKIIGEWFSNKFHNDPLLRSSADTSPSVATPLDVSTNPTFDIDKIASRIGELKYKASGAETQNQWTKDMSDTSIQRSVADMQAAGFNPLLSLGGGMSGASSPSSSSGSGSSNLIGPLLAGIANIVSASIHAASNDNRALTMANSATALNTARILSNEGINQAKLDAMASLNAAKAKYFDHKANDKSTSILNRALADYYESKGKNKNPKDWVDDYWKNFK